jgi:hypothetical protein
LAAHSVTTKPDWQHILGKNMICSTFWEKTTLLTAHSEKKKTWLAAHSGKNMSGSTFWQKT